MSETNNEKLEEAVDEVVVETAENKNDSIATETVQVQSDDTEGVLGLDVADESQEKPSALLEAAKKALTEKKEKKSKEKKVKDVEDIVIPEANSKTKVDKAAVLALTRRIFLAKWPLLLVPAILLSAIGGLVLGVMMAGNSDNAIAVGVSIIVGGIAIPIIIFLANYFVMLPKNAQSATEWRKKTLLVNINNDRIFIKQKTTPIHADSEYADIEYKWEKFIKLLSLKNYIFLFVGRNQAVVIDLLETPKAEINKLKQAINQRIKKEKVIV